MSLALFDLDNTLLGGDSDYLWGQFLVENQLVDAEWYEQENQRFYQAYCHGTLNTLEYLAFALRPLAEHNLSELQTWRQRFMVEKIHPIMLSKAQALLQRHREAGDTLLIITSTNRFITEPIALALDVPHLLATEPEMKNHRYTGQICGIPCFQEGKVQHLQTWLTQTGHSLENSWGYSDSHNDLPLLKQVTHPIAVDPDAELTRHAQTQGWPIISLRD